ncbi:MAG: hypothetical protein IKD04_04640 [Clostridia bacterium]|nr:hypothetical protein [Clostridia bacterium]
MIYLELGTEANTKFTVRRCIYLDRVRGGKYYATPQKLVTKHFNQSDILDVVATELDRQYYGIEFSDEFSELSTKEFIEYKLNELKKGYKFLIFVGEGKIINELPSTLTTRLANRIHRKIYLRISYYKDNLGAVEAYYYDRSYKAKTKVIPQMLTTVFVEYNRKTIIDTVNRELDCDFTDIIIADKSIDVENNTFALCGNV